METTRFDALWKQLEREDRKSTRLNSSHTEIYTLPLYDALPICRRARSARLWDARVDRRGGRNGNDSLRCVVEAIGARRSEEHTSELQSHRDLHSSPIRRSSDLSTGA